MSPKVLVINRTKDIARLDAFRLSAETVGVTPQVVVADDAHRSDFPFAMYSSLVGNHFWGEATIKPGAIGCFLSHRRAWQIVARSTDPYVLICEDDCDLIADPSGLIAMAESKDLPDIIFGNCRLASWAEQGPASHSLSFLLDHIAGLGGPIAAGVKSSPGADCYLLSPFAANRLLELTTQQRIVCGVDWAMLWNCLTDVPSNVRAALPELGTLAAHLPVCETPLRAVVATRPISRQRKGPSVIRHSVTVPIRDLVQKSKSLAHTEYVSTIGYWGTNLTFAGRSGPDPVMMCHRAGDIWDEPGLVQLIQHFPEGGTFVDIGAHIGNHSVVMGRLAGASKIIAAEANEEITRLLSTNVASNGLTSRFSLVESGIAIGMTDGEAWLIRNRRKSSETMVKNTRPDEDAGDAEPMRTISGDTLIGSARVDAVKIDTSGSEIDILRGLFETLKNQRPVVLVDFSVRGRDRIERLAQNISYKIASTQPSSRTGRFSFLLLPV